jgi:transposase
MPDVMLTMTERDTLQQWTRRPRTAQALAQRARIVLACADGHSNTAVAARLHVAKPTVGKWRARFLAKRLDGLLDEPRPGAPRSITDADVERVVARTLEATPRDATHWSTRSMAQACGLSQSAISRIWRAFGLQPHRTETVSVVEGSAVCREGAGHCRALSASAGQGAGPVRR